MKSKIIITLFAVLSILITGCGGGGGGGAAGGAAAGLTTAQAQAKATGTNTTVVNSVVRVASFSGVQPSGSISKVSSTPDENSQLVLMAMRSYLGLNPKPSKVRKSVNKAVSSTINENGGVVTYTEANTTEGYSFTYTLRFYNASDVLLQGSQIPTAVKMVGVINGYETIDGVIYTYSNSSLTLTGLNNPTYTMTGSGTLTTSDGSSFTFSSNNLVYNESTGLVTGGSIEINGSDGDTNVTVTSTFQANGSPVVTVKENNTTVSSGAVAFGIRTVNNGAVTFQSNSATLTHAYIGDMVDGTTKIYDVTGSFGGQGYNASITISQSNTVVKVCGINARKFFFGFGLPDGSSIITDEYIAQDSQGNLWDMGDSEDSPPSCNQVALFYPVTMDLGTSYTTVDYFDNTSAQSSVTATGISRNSFVNLIELTSNASNGAQAKEYLSQTYGLAVFESNETVDGQPFNITVVRRK